MRELQSGTDILRDIIENFLVPAFRPQARGHVRFDALRLAFQTHGFGRRVQANQEATLAKEVEHYVHMTARKTPAFGKHPGFFGKDIEIKAESIPRQDCESGIDEGR